MEFTEKDLLIIEFAMDKLNSKNSQKLLKELATLKEKVNKVIKIEEIKSTQW